MKMTELRAENEALKQQISLLSKQKEGEKDNPELSQLKEKNSSLKKSVKDLKTEKTHLSKRIKALENDVSAREQDQQTLKEELEHLQQQLSKLSDVHTQAVTEVEGLRADHQALQEKEAQLQLIQAEVDRLQPVEKLCGEKTTQVESLQAELAEHHQLLAQARTAASSQAAEYQDQYVKLNNELEMDRNRRQAELEAQREQSGAEIALLQAQKDSLSAKVTELTEKLKLVATSLERQLSEKRKIASQYEANVKEYQAYKDGTKNQVNDLMGLLQKMASELDASRASHPVKDTQPIKVNKDNPANLAGTSATDQQLHQQVQELRNQLSNLNEINAQQNRELMALSERMKRINHVLTTPRGRLLAQLLGLKK